MNKRRCPLDDGDDQPPGKKHRHGGGAHAGDRVEVLTDDNLLHLILGYTDRVTLIIAKFVSPLWRSLAQRIRAKRGTGHQCGQGPMRFDEMRYIEYPKHRCRWRFLCRAARVASLNMLRWLYDTDSRFGDEGRLHRAIAATDNVDALRWAIGVCPLNAFNMRRLFMHAAVKGSINVIDLLHASGFGLWHNGDIRGAIHTRAFGSLVDVVFQVGHVAIIEWLHGRGLALKGRMLARAAEHGHLHIVKWLHAQGLALSRSVFLKAIEGASERHTPGYLHDRAPTTHERHDHRGLEIIEWLIEMDCPRPRCPRPAVVQGCCVHVIRVLHRHGIVRDRHMPESETGAQT